MPYEPLRDYLQTMRTKYDPNLTIDVLRIITDDDVCFELKPGCDIRKLDTYVLTAIMGYTIPVEKYVKTREQLISNIVDKNLVSALIVSVKPIRTPMTANELIGKMNSFDSYLVSSRATVTIDGYTDHYSVYGCDTTDDGIVVIHACEDGDLNCGG